MAAIIAMAVYFVQILCTCALAAILWLIIKGLLSLMKVKMSKCASLICFVVIFVVLCAVLTYVSKNPVVICPDEYTEIITDEQIENMQSIAAGVYSPYIPLIPALASIETVQWLEEYSSYEIRFRINYLFFGSETLVMGGDGISVVKPLGSQ